MAASRRITLHSVLAPDKLIIKDATVREELGRMSIMDLDLLSPDENLALDDLLGHGFAVELHAVEPRIDPPPGTPHIADIILRARRR